MATVKFTFLYTLATCMIIGEQMRTTTAVSSSYICPGVGLYPDPTDCHNFYSCDSSLTPILGTCMNGKGTYDSSDQICRVTPCSGPPPNVPTTRPADFTCSAVGLFPDPDNCHNFYSCDENLVAIPGTCLKGNGTFDAVNRVCLPGPCPSPFVCSRAGFFADPEDCHSFYSCSNDLVPIHSTCTANGYFDPVKICVIGACIQTTTPSSSQSPTATPSLTSSSTPSPKPAFQCPGVGYFPDPRNCRAYYVCDLNSNYVRGVCMGGGGYFDNKSKGCYIGSC